MSPHFDLDLADRIPIFITRYPGLWWSTTIPSLLTNGWAVQKIFSGQSLNSWTEGHGDSCAPPPPTPPTLLQGYNHTTWHPTPPPTNTHTHITLQCTPTPKLCYWGRTTLYGIPTLHPPKKREKKENRQIYRSPPNPHPVHLKCKLCGDHREHTVLIRASTLWWSGRVHCGNQRGYTMVIREGTLWWSGRVHCGDQREHTVLIRAGTLWWSGRYTVVIREGTYQESTLWWSGKYTVVIREVHCDDQGGYRLIRKVHCGDEGGTLWWWGRYTVVMREVHCGDQGGTLWWWGRYTVVIREGTLWWSGRVHCGD